MKGAAENMGLMFPFDCVLTWILSPRQVKHPHIKQKVTENDQVYYN